MNIPKIWKQAVRAAANNAPTILTAIGVTGTIATAVLAGKASFKAAEIISQEQARLDLEEKSHPLTAQEKLKLVWPQYIPAVVTISLTVSAVVGSNRISSKRAAALASAYTVSQEFFDRYKDKVVKAMGEEKAKEINNEVAKELVGKNPPPPLTTVFVGNNEVCWVHDDYTDHWFKSTHAALEQAVIDINFQILNEGTATLGDFYRILGVTHAAIYDEVGWNHEKKLEVSIGSTKMEDNSLAYTLDFRTIPVRGY